MQFEISILAVFVCLSLPLHSHITNPKRLLVNWNQLLTNVNVKATTVLSSLGLETPAQQRRISRFKTVKLHLERLHLERLHQEPDCAALWCHFPLEQNICALNPLLVNKILSKELWFSEFVKEHRWCSFIRLFWMPWSRIGSKIASLVNGTY